MVILLTVILLTVILLTVILLTVILYIRLVYLFQPFLFLKSRDRTQTLDLEIDETFAECHVVLKNVILFNAVRPKVVAPFKQSLTKPFNLTKTMLPPAGRS
jgi:hypothetical protein